jgi:hypothetical protein
MQVKPLYQTQKRPVAKKTAQVGKAAPKTQQHSKRSQRVSDHYHAHVAGGTKAVDRMNPTATPDNDVTVSAYPGLTN